MIEIIQIVASILVAVAAVAALYLSYRNEKRNQDRFADQLKLSQEIASANIRPLLTIHSQIYVNDIGISLINKGIGTAVITDIEFEKDGRTTKSIVDFFDLGSDIMWDTFWKFSEKKSYLSAGKKRQLVELTVGNLKTQGWPEEKAIELLSRWQEQKRGIKIRIEYSDVLGNSIEPYCDTLN